jgi:hypothetical protein
MRQIEQMPLFGRTSRQIRAPFSRQMVRCLQLLATVRRIGTNESFRVSALPAIHVFATGIEFGIGSGTEVTTVVVVFEGNNVALVAGYRGTVADIPEADFVPLAAEIDRAIALKTERPRQPGAEP